MTGINGAPKIMVIGSDIIALTDVEKRLQKMGYRNLARLTCGEDAVKQAGLNPPDIVLMDITLEGRMDGASCAYHFWQKLDVPVLFITNQFGGPGTARTRLAEPFGYLFRPFDDREIKLTIEAALCKARIFLKKKRKREAPAKAARQWQATFDSISDPVSVIDMQGRILRCNISMAAFLEKEQSEIIGRTCWELVYGVKGPAKDCPFTAMKKSRCRESKVMNIGSRWIKVTVDPILSDNGELENAVQILNDITEQKKNEAALRLTQFSIDSAADAIFWIETGAGVVYANKSASRLLGYSLEELLSMKIYDLDLHMSPGRWRKHVERLRLVKSFCLESHHYDKTGRKIPVEITCNHLEFEDNEYCVAFVRDITARKMAQEELKEANNRLETILGGVAVGIYALSPQGQVVFANDQAAGFLDYKTVEDMLQDPFSKQIIDKFEITDQSGQLASLEKLPGRQSLQDKQPSETTLKFKHRRKDFTKWAIVKAIPVLDERREVTLAVIICHDITKIKLAEGEKENLITELQKALSEVKRLSGFLPICANCMKIRDDEGYWQRIEKYIQDRSEAFFSHSICPDCARQLYPELYKRKAKDCEV